jgi:hypothetical protein
LAVLLVSSVCVTTYVAATEKVAVTGRDLELQVESCLKKVKYLVSGFQQAQSTGEFFTGKIWLSKEDETKVRIQYLSGSNQNILIINGKVIIFNIIDGKLKKYTYSISQTPIYSILVGNLDLSKEKYEILENSEDVLAIEITKSTVFTGMTVVLVFSKYKESGNIQHLEVWSVGSENGKEGTVFNFIHPRNINDKSKIPDDVFDEKSVVQSS